MRTIFFRTLWSIALVIVAGVSVSAQNRDADAILNNALEKLGGEAKIRSFKSVYFSAKGTEDGTAAAQAADPEKASLNAHEEKLAVFMDGKRLAYELKTDRGDGTRRWRRFMFTDAQRTVLDFGTMAVFASPVRFPSIDRDQDARRFPHAFLLEVIDRQQTLQFVGQKSFEGRDHEVLSIVLPNAKMPVSLYFDSKTAFLSKYEYSTDFPGIGKALIEYVFHSYRSHSELKAFPSEHQIKINGKTWRSVKYDAALVDSKEADEMLTVPAELEGAIIPSGTVKEISKGVYYAYGIGGSFQPMFIEFKDFVVAVEAPANHPSVEETPIETIGNMNAASDEFIAKIKQAVPNKPIRYVVLTHCHSDYMGGLRAFLAEKSIVLTSPGNEKFYKAFVPELTVETFDKKRVITDGDKTIELINVGANPHTAENIVVYLPKENYLFQGDLFYYNGEATFPPHDRMTIMPFFAKWLKANRLAPARIYGFHGPLFATMEHVEKVLTMSGEKNR